MSEYENKINKKIMKIEYTRDNENKMKKKQFPIVASKLLHCISKWRHNMEDSVASMKHKAREATIGLRKYGWQVDMTITAKMKVTTGKELVSKG